MLCCGCFSWHHILDSRCHLVSIPKQISFQKQRNASCENVYVSVNEGTSLSVWKWLKQFKLCSEAPIFCSTHNMTGLLSPDTWFQTFEVLPRKVSHHHHTAVFICSFPFLLRHKTEILLQWRGCAVLLL